MTIPSTSDFWTDHRTIMTVQLPTYYTTLQTILGKYHVEEESFTTQMAQTEIVPLRNPSRGQRTYCGMHFYLREPQRFVGMESAPRLSPDTASDMPLGYITDAWTQGWTEVELGMAQAWYYPTEQRWVLWECFFMQRWRTHPWDHDENMFALWRHVEGYLLALRPEAMQIVTPPYYHVADPKTDGGYQRLLAHQGYTPLSPKAWGKCLKGRD